jgi:predicted dehydrogenase
MTQPERVVVVGAGSISRAWLPRIKDEHLTVAALVDLDTDIARQRAEQFELSDTEVSDDLGAMLQKHRPDFVLDLTVPAAHRQVTCAALEAGVPVLGEKPLADSLEAAREMTATAERTGTLYMVSQSRRWEPHHATIQKSVADGQVGQLTTANCDFYIGAHFGGFRAAMQSPLILDMAIHHFDLARMLTGKDPLAVYCHEFNPAGSWYDGNAAATCVFEMTDGVVFTYRGSWCAEGFNTSWHGNWRLVGTEGAILYENDQPPKGQRAVPTEEGLLWDTEDFAPDPVSMEPTLFHGALRTFLGALRTGQTPPTECHDNIKSLAMVFAAIDSARTKQRVEIKP